MSKRQFALNTNCALEVYGVFAVSHLGFSSKQFQSCNKSRINQACSGPYWENIGPWSFLYGPRCARSVLSRPRADILPVRPSRLVNKIYLFLRNVTAVPFLWLLVTWKKFDHVLRCLSEKLKQRKRIIRLYNHTVSMWYCLVRID